MAMNTKQSGSTAVWYVCARLRARACVCYATICVADAQYLGLTEIVWWKWAQSGCNSPGTGCVHRPEDSPLLFDLTVDEAEGHALDTTQAPYAAIVKTMVAMRQSENLDINTTARSLTDYRSGPAGRAANCCNDAKPACAC